MDDKLQAEIKEYCRLNDLEYHAEIDKMLKDAFTRLKYGDSPRIAKKKKKPLEPVKIKEKVVKKVVTTPRIKKEVIKKEVLPKNNGKLDMYGE
jgi:hypothetical protein